MGANWRKYAETIGVGSLALAIGILAFVHEGVPAAEVDLNDGGVWVTNGSQMLVGHLNYESRTLDGGLRATATGFDLSQFGTNVMVTGPEVVQQLDTASVAFANETSVSGVSYAHGDENVLFADTAEGKVWASSLEGIGGFNPKADALIEELDAPRVAVGVDGDAFVVTRDGVVRTVKGAGENALVEEIGELGAELSDAASLTVVGDTLVAFDDATVRTIGRSIDVPGSTDAVLQQPSSASSDVLLATGESLIRLPLDGGEPVVTDVPKGAPARPVSLEGCAYGLWAKSGYYLRDCEDAALNEAAQFPELAAATDPVFRTNRSVLVINDLVTGDVYLPLESMLRVDNWDLITSHLTEELEEKESEEATETELSQLQEFSEEQHPPVANDDRLGARPGAATTLPLLLNDVDVDGDVLTAEITSQPPGFTVSPAKDGRAARVEVPKEATGRFTFRYRASDGVDLSNEATVTVVLSPDGVNGAPERIRSNTVQVAERATEEYSVLPDWVDPDGDPLFLENAVGEEGLSVTWRPDGYISLHDLGTGGPGRRTIVVTVSDGVESTSEELVVRILPGSSNQPPVANNDHFVANVGETITLRPLSNDTDADGDSLRLVEMGAVAPEVDLVANYDDNSAQFTASAAGSQTIVYSISDGPNNTKGKVRVDVVDPKKAEKQPAAENDLALMSQSGTVVVEPLNNDFDPAGGVLVIQGVSMGTSEGLNVEVVNHSLLRVTAPAGIDEPQTFEYTISNGKASATASVLVVPLEPQSEIQPPVAEPDETVVRAGDIVTVDVLANDYSPADLPIKLLPDPEVLSDPALGEFFLSGDQVRFHAGDKAGTAEAIYTVADSQKNVASARVTITIRDFDKGNQHPAPRAVTGRTFSGMTTRIPVPMDGVDPDGDSVELMGTGKTGPSRGSVKVEGNVLVYTASKVDPGTDTFSYRVTDRFGAEADGVVRVGIAPAPSQNQDPVAVPDEIAARPGTRLEIPVVKNDVDPDGDSIVLVEGSITPVENKWEPTEAGIKGQRITLVTPEQEGVYQLYYGITDQRSAPVVGVVTITVDKNVPPVAPIAKDDYVSMDTVSGKESVEVPVLDNDWDPDGTTEGLTVEVEEPVTVQDGVVTVPLEADRQIVLYTVRDADDMTARAAIVVPGKDQLPPRLDPEKVPAKVKGGETLTVDLGEYVLTRAGHSAKLTAVDSVVAGPGGSTEDEDLGVKVIDDTTISFTPDVLFHGATSLGFEVTDGDSVDDPRGLKATLSLPITVESSGLFPPELRPGSIQVAPGEAPVEVSLGAMVDDPDPGDNEKMAFAVTSAADPIDASIDGQSIGVSVPADTPVGTTGNIVVSVHDGTTDPLEMTLPVTVTRSTRPLMTVTDVTEPEGRVGKEIPFDLTTIVTNPFADQGGEIEIVGEPSVEGPAKARKQGLTVLVTPTASGNNGDTAEDAVISYTVADATKDPSRNRTGTIRVVIKDVPMAPTEVSAEAVGSRTARVTWKHAGWRGGDPDGFTVSWGNGSKDCGLQTSCEIDTLSNNNTYAFTVTARVKESDIADSAPSAASNDIFVDAMPNAPEAPTAAFGDQQIDLTWPTTTVPDGGSPVTSYTVEIMPADASGRTQQVVSGTSMTWNNLRNGTAYTFTLTAHNKLTEMNRVTAPTGPESAPETPAGAPSNQGAPRVVKDRAAAGVDPRATVSWSAPGNPNGDTSFTYQMRQRGTENLLYEGSGTSSVVTMSVGTQDKTFEVRSTNKSGKWSDWSPASNAVRAFQPPGAPSDLSLSATGEGTVVRFNFGAAAGNGARSGEITYRWNAGGASGTVRPGQEIDHAAFALGSNVRVQVRAISTVDGESAEGPVVTATVNTYAPPNQPTVSASRASNGQVDLSWEMSRTSNGRDVTVEIRTTQNGTARRAERSGSTQEGSGPNQNVCISARAVNSEGQASAWNERCASTRGAGTAYLLHGPAIGTCRWGGEQCDEQHIRLQGWYPNSRVTCTVSGAGGGRESLTFTNTYTVDGNGNMGQTWHNPVQVGQTFQTGETPHDGCHY